MELVHEEINPRSEKTYQFEDIDSSENGSSSDESGLLDFDMESSDDESIKSASKRNSKTRDTSESSDDMSKKEDSHTSNVGESTSSENDSPKRTSAEDIKSSITGGDNPEDNVKEFTSQEKYRTQGTRKQRERKHRSEEGRGEDNNCEEGEIKHREEEGDKRGRKHRYEEGTSRETKHRDEEGTIRETKHRDEEGTSREAKHRFEEGNKRERNIRGEEDTKREAEDRGEEYNRKREMEREMSYRSRDKRRRIDYGNGGYKYSGKPRKSFRERFSDGDKSPHNWYQDRGQSDIDARPRRGDGVRYSEVDRRSEGSWYNKPTEDQITIRSCDYFNSWGFCRHKSGHLSHSGFTRRLHICRRCLYKLGTQEYHSEKVCDVKL